MERETKTGITLELFRHFMLALDEPPPPRCFVFHKRWTDDPICLAAIEQNLRGIGMAEWTVTTEGTCVYFTEVKK